MNATAILLDALENIPETVSLTIDYPQQKLAQTVPGGHDLKHWLLGYYSSSTVERDPPIGYGADVDRPASASVQCFKQFKVPGEDTDTPTYKLNGRTLIDIDLPPDTVEKCYSKHTGN
jgi:hypothetical protein